MLHTITQLVRSEPWQVAVELIVIWICAAVLFRFLRETRGAGAMKGFVVLLVVATLIIRLLTQGTGAFERLEYIYNNFLAIIAIMLVVIFQPELRQAMIRLGHTWTIRTGSGTAQGAISPIAEAVQFLAKAQFGALIAIERQSRLGSLADAGIQLDAEVSARLLESIFWPNSPLHDLGVVIRGDRVLAASVQFPLAEEGALAQRFGSRHRAAVGLASESDCLIIIVSEETGAISIAEHGRLDHDIPASEFEAELARRLALAPPTDGGSAAPETAAATSFETSSEGDSPASDT